MRKLLGRIEGVAAGVLLAAIAVLIVAQLVLTQVAPAWASPLTTVVLALFVWASMLGVAAATRRGAHLSLALLRRLVPGRWQWVLRAVLLAATIAFFIALTATSARLCADQARWGNRFVGASWPAWLVTMSIPSAAALSCVRAVEAWWVARAGGRGGRAQEAQAPPGGQGPRGG